MRIIIVGAGPGGYETAVEAAKRGLEVVLVSAGPVGGTCLNEGCIPTKTLCHAAETMPEGGIDMAATQQRKTDVILQLRSGIESLLKNKLITFVEGVGSLVDAHTVKVGETEYTADAVIIATGSASVALPIPGADLPEVVDSTAMLNLQSVPKRLCIIGGGVIGLEFASIYKAFGSEVTVLEYAPNILPRFDVDLAKRLKQSLGKRGIAIETAAQVTGVVKTDDGVAVTYLKKEKEFSVPADLVLMAVGRRPVLMDGLDACGVAYTRRGITVDENMQTSVPGVYAVGDVNGGIMLAHVASFEGTRALNHICGVSDSIDFSIVPAAVFTVPEVATVGLTEEECKDKGIAFKALKSFYRANGKAVSMEASDGLCKFLVEEGTGKILGCHIMGAHSSDLIHEASVLMNLGATVDQARNMIHAHPSLAEVLQAALR